MHQDDLMWPEFNGPASLQEIERVPLSKRGLPTSTFAVLERAAERWPARPALSVHSGGEPRQAALTRTFDELATDVRRAAHALHESGVGRREAVALLSVSCDEMITALLAAQAVGVAVPLDPRLAVDHVIDLVESCAARVIVASGPELDAGAWEAARQVAAATDAVTLLALRPTGAAGEPPELEPLAAVAVAYFQDRVAQAQADGFAVVAEAQDHASYVRVCGASGAARLAVRTHRNEVCNAWQVASTASPGTSESTFAAMPLFHPSAAMLTLIGPLLRGQPVRWPGPLDDHDLRSPEAVWPKVERRRAAAGAAAPAFYAARTRNPLKADVTLRLPYQHVKAVRVDPSSGNWTPLEPGEVGTIVVRGPSVFPGYLQPNLRGPLPDHGGAIRDGWLNTGDVGSVDADGFITLARHQSDAALRDGQDAGAVYQGCGL